MLAGWWLTGFKIVKNETDKNEFDYNVSDLSNCPRCMMTGLPTKVPGNEPVHFFDMVTLLIWNSNEYSNLTCFAHYQRPLSQFYILFSYFIVLAASVWVCVSNVIMCPVWCIIFRNLTGDKCLIEPAYRLFNTCVYIIS